MYLQLKTASSQKLELQNKLQSRVQEAEGIQKELAGVRIELSSSASRNALQSQQIADAEKVHATTVNELRSMYEEANKIREEAQSRQEGTQQELEQLLKEKSRLNETLDEEDKLVAVLRADLECAKKVSTVHANLSERKEQVGFFMCGSRILAHARNLARAGQEAL